MEANEKALALFHGDAGDAHPLARWGEARVVRALATRVMLTDGRKVPLNEGEAILVAQAALAYRLDPFMGEIVAWVKEQQSGRRILTVMKGRDGVLKIAKANAAVEGTYLENPRFYRVIEEQRKLALGAGKDDMVIECWVPDKKSTDSYYERIAICKEAGYSKVEIDEKVGATPPADYGLGIVTADEIENRHYYHNNKGERTGTIDVKFTDVELCQKRAMMAALRKRWAAQEFLEPVGGSTDTDDYIVDAEWMVVEPEKATDPVERAERAQAGREALFGGGPVEQVSRPYPPVVVKNKVGRKVEEGAKKKIQLTQGQRGMVIGAMNEALGDDKKRHTVLKFLFNTDSAKNLADAEFYGLMEWLTISKDSGGTYLPSPIACQELERIVTEAMTEAHEGTLFDGTAAL
jgi:hypothetical protein